MHARSKRSFGIRDLLRKLRAKRTTGRALAGTTAAGVTVQLTLIVTGVIVARALGPEGRGHFALLTLIAALLWQLAPMGLPAALIYSVARLPGRATDTLRQLRKPILIRLLLGVAVAALLLAILTRGRPGSVQAGGLIVLLAVPGWISHQIALGVLQGLRRFAPFNILRIAPNTIFAVAATVLLVSGAASFVRITLAWGASRTVLAPVSLLIAWRAARAAEDPGSGPAPETSWLLRYGRRAMWGTSSPVETYRLDQAVVALFLPPAALGFYVVALAFTSLPRFLAESVGMVASPIVADSNTRGQAHHIMWRFFFVAIPFYMPLIAALWIVAPTLVNVFFGAEFESAASLTRLLLTATAIYCARRVLTDGARAAGLPGLGSLAEITGLLSSLPLFAILVPRWGNSGVAAALIGSSIIALVTLLIGLFRPSSQHEGASSGWLERTP